ncbi:J domain-containing protein [Oxalobacteraceae bacterium OM1]|nr:J domain-containing protein [Oxalobacteraceae bacterium OM1]
MEFKDYYQTLGVERTAGADEIKKAYRKLARKYHPDVSKEPDAEARMKDVNEAFAVLSDPEKRAAYDNVGQSAHAGQEFRPPPGWNTGYEFSDNNFSEAEAADFSDFFSELFGSRGGGARRQHTQFRARGEDHHAKVMLDIEDAYHGAAHAITLRVPQVDDQGHVTLAERTLDVRIPKGVHEGQLIRLAGQGTPGIGGGEPGDLYLEVAFRPHASYRAEGRDVYATLPIAPWEAALGATIQAPVPGGTVEVRIPENSQGGRKLRLKGRGIPGATPGDLYLVLEIVLPPAHTARARELYETMAREMAFNPRQGV